MTNPSRGELVPGGLAMIKGLSDLSHLNGNIVTTEYLVKDGHVFANGAKFIGGGCGWLCTGNGLFNRKNGELYPSPFAIIHSSSLMPINPEPDPLQINHEEQQEQSA